MVEHARETQVVDRLRQLARSRLWDVGAVVVALLALVRLGGHLPGRFAQWDFNHYYATAWLLRQGQNPYTTPMAPVCDQLGLASASDIPVATTPPALLWLLVPLAKLPVRVAFKVWVLLEIVSLAAVFGLTAHFLRGAISRRGWLFLVTGTLASDAVLAHFYYSRLELTLAAALLAAFGSLRSGRGAAACALVTAVGALKLYPLALLPWFVWRAGMSWRLRTAAAGAAALLAGTVLAVTGPGLWRDFFEQASPIVSGFALRYSLNFSLPSFLARLACASHLVPPTNAVFWPVAMTAGCVLLAISTAVCLSGRAVLAVEFGLLSVALVAGSPLAWGHYFVFLIFPVAVSAAAVRRTPTGLRVMALAACVALLFAFDRCGGALVREHLWLDVLVNYRPLYGALGLWILLSAELKRVRHGSTPTPANYR